MGVGDFASRNAFVDFGIGRDKAIEDHLHSERSLDGDNSRGKFYGVSLKQDDVAIGRNQFSQCGQALGYIVAHGSERPYVGRKSTGQIAAHGKLYK